MPLFDQYSTTYGEAVQDSIRFSGLRHEFFIKAKADLLRSLVRARFAPGEGRKLLDVGCGIGEMHTHLEGIFERICGVDVSASSITAAKARYPENDYRVMEDGRIPYPSAVFDMVTAVCVLHHVEPTQWPAFLAELMRVVRPRGIVCIIEHNPFNPLTRLAVMRCPFDKDARLLSAGRTRRLMQDAGLRDVTTRHFLLFPFRSGLTERIERGLGAIPLGAQYIATGECPAGDNHQRPDAEPSVHGPAAPGSETAGP
jgi:ubiquinone/menaquinone biosynthesis C-methylase UbiE